MYIYLVKCKVLEKEIFFKKVCKYNSALCRKAFLTDKGLPLMKGDLVHRPELTATLQRIAEYEADTYYNGSLAEDVVADLRECGKL